MIGGTSTGGLIAIMLGRLRMSLRDCEKAYLQLSERIFNPKRHSLHAFGKAKDFLMANGKFDSQALEDAIKEVVVSIAKMPEGELLQDPEPECKVKAPDTLADDSYDRCVSTTRVKNSQIAVLRSYENNLPETLYDDCKIWEACRATSAAPTFFDPVKIGPYDQEFVDGGLLYNNPIQLVHREAVATWHNRVDGAVFISIGTGSAPSGAFEGNLKIIIEAMKEIVTQTERISTEFAESHPELLLRNCFFRFQVFHGLETVGLEEYKEKAKIADATQSYLDIWETKKKVEDCVEKVCATTWPVSPPRTTCFVVPFERDSKFIGRNDIITQIGRKFEAQRRVALAGIGGVG
ncbi:hypothetical protein GP486_002769 [Trichoglossum hirsutum]|uniref:PNPLA domain-containing protein n=1 Tax=Trichoglossum hirsutum TaxID=265104 RepID=A0A9P8RRD2_9PEZI|nr:hypothetical protein GP486_002769 [Trichoglossum hirsutum]